MASGFGYKFGKSLGGVLIFTYLLAAVMGVGGSVMGLDTMIGFNAWYYFAGAIVAGLLILYFVPRPFDLILLSPLAVYGGVKQLGLTWTMAVIVMAVPVILVVLMSLGKKT